MVRPRSSRSLLNKSACNSINLCLRVFKPSSHSWTRMSFKVHTRRLGILISFLRFSKLHSLPCIPRREPFKLKVGIWAKFWKQMQARDKETTPHTFSSRSNMWAQRVIRNSNRSFGPTMLKNLSMAVGREIIKKTTMITMSKSHSLLLMPKLGSTSN